MNDVAYYGVVLVALMVGGVGVAVVFFWLRRGVAREWERADTINPSVGVSPSTLRQLLVRLDAVGFCGEVTEVMRDYAKTDGSMADYRTPEQMRELIENVDGCRAIIRECREILAPLYAQTQAGEKP